MPLIIFSAFINAFTEKEAQSAGASALVSKSERRSVLVGKGNSGRMVEICTRTFAQLREPHRCTISHQPLGIDM